MQSMNMIDNVSVPDKRLSAVGAKRKANVGPPNRGAVSASMPAYRKIAERLKAEFRAECKRGDNLAPSESQLIHRFGVSATTARRCLDELENEGIVVRQQGLGTFITQTAIAIHVGVYWTDDTFKTYSSAFYSQLSVALDEIFDAHGYQLHHYIAHASRWARSSREHLCEDMAAGRLEGLLVVGCGEPEPWIVQAVTEMKRPAVYLNGSKAPIGYTVQGDYDEMLRLGVRYAVEHGRQDVAAICDNEALFTGVAETLKSLGGRTCPEWQIALPHCSEASGYMAAQRLLDQPHRPQAVVIADDVVARGFAYGVVARQIRVPEDLLVIAHANKDSGLFYPFPVVKLEVVPEKYARTMADMLMILCKGRPLKQNTVFIKPHLVAPSVGMNG